jgi:hypothetical protein
VAFADAIGVPESKPVTVLKLKPLLIVGKIEKLAIDPPEEEIVYPVIGIPTVDVSES